MRLAEARETVWDDAESRDCQPEELRDVAVWLVGSSCTIADLSYLTWARAAHRLGIDLETEFPEVNQWGEYIYLTACPDLTKTVANMMNREGVIEGLTPKAITP